MRHNDAVFAPPPPSLMEVDPQNPLPEQEPTTSSGGGQTSSSPPADVLNSSVIVTVLILATAIIVSASIFLLIRCLSHYHNRLRRRRSSTIEIDAMASDDSFRHGSTATSTRRVAPEQYSSIIDSLPLFTFASIATNSGGDCAVCLSKFERQDQLRLLPVCCHAFHADCIDPWLANNQTCPLCRSSIILSESEVMSKILSNRSFRVEIGSVSRRIGTAESRRSYSIGSFDYIVDDDVISEVTVASTTRRRSESAGAGDKSGRTEESEIQTLAAEVAAVGERGRGSWLKDYVDRMNWTPSFSLSSSFRSSGRFFAGSSRRTEVPRVLESDLEASRLGDEIGEMFRWLSGV